MGISVNQYRCTIGLHHRNTGEGRPVTSGRSYSTLNPTKTLTDIIFSLTYRRRNILTDWAKKRLISVGITLFLAILSYLMAITLAMLVDLAKTKAYAMESTKYFHDLKNHQSITLNAAKSLLNWWVVLILLFPSRDPGGVGGYSNLGNYISSNTYYSTYSTHLPLNLFILRSNYHRNSKRGNLLDILSSTYTLYSCTINLILIVIVTPSIVNPGPIPPPTNTFVVHVNLR